MRLLYCHIDNFGKLQDADLDLRGGLHTIEEENGWGKSTFAAFLLVMFYGFANEKKRSIIENERRRYAPWQNGVYGGTVTFEARGRIYRLERTFGIRDAAEDTYAVYDAETNLPVDRFRGSIGEDLFSIDRESFCRTVFIAQQDCGTEATSGIQARIGHLEEDRGDMASYSDVQMVLKKELDALTPGRKTGEISRLTHEIAVLETDVLRRDVQEVSLAHLEEQLSAQKKRQAELEKEIEENTEQLRKFSVSRQTAKNFSLTEAEEARLQELDSVFASGVPEDEDLEEAEDRFRGIRRMQAECERLRQVGRPSVKKEKPQATKRNGSSPIAALVFALFAAAIMSFFFNKILMAVLIGAGILIMILTSIHDKKTGDDEIEVIIKDPVKFPWKDGNVLEAQRLEQEKREEIWEAEEELQAFLRQYYPSFSEEDDLSRKLQQLHYDKNEYLDLQEKEERARSAGEAYERSAAEMHQMLWHEAGEETRELSPEEIREEIEAGRSEMIRMDQQIRGTERQIEDLRGSLDKIAEEEEQLETERARLQSLKHRYMIVSRTKEYLAMARAAFTARYMEPIKTSFDRYYALLSGGNDKEFQLDADLNITAREYGAQRDTDLLSEGYKDLVGLCRRMAMIEAMYEEEKPFLIFDDPFVNLDGRKMEKAMQFLRRISQEYQVIYLTCHDSRVPRE